MELIKAVHEIEGVKRIRLGSLEPRIYYRGICTGIRKYAEDMPAFSSFPAKRL